MRHFALPVMQSDGHGLPSVYRVLHTLAKTAPQKQKHGTFNICIKPFFQKTNIRSLPRKNKIKLLHVDKF